LAGGHQNHWILGDFSIKDLPEAIDKEFRQDKSRFI